MKCMEDFLLHERLTKELIVLRCNRSRDGSQERMINKVLIGEGRSSRRMGPQTLEI